MLTSGSVIARKSFGFEFARSQLFLPHVRDVTRTIVLMSGVGHNHSRTSSWSDRRSGQLQRSSVQFKHTMHSRSENFLGLYFGPVSVDSPHYKCARKSSVTIAIRTRFEHSRKNEHFQFFSILEWCCSPSNLIETSNRARIATVTDALLNE